MKKRVIIYPIRAAYRAKIIEKKMLILTINMILALLIFLQLFFTVLLIAMTAGKKPTATPDSMDTSKPSDIQIQLEHNSKKYALSSREVEILLLLREGLPYKLIGDRLHISQRTVSSHVANMFEKVSVTNKMELVNKVFLVARLENSC